MKTLIIFTTTEEIIPKFKLIEGIYADLDGFVIGLDENETKQAQCEKLIWLDDYAGYQSDLTNTFPIDFNPKEDKIARIGFVE